MALLDEKRDQYVVRVVYDGPPFSGKTTTLKALSRAFSRTLESPHEHSGRTVYFDWLDYTAGRYQGRPIRCQLVSVPGQKSLVSRRRQLLRDADAIVFVADTRQSGLELSLQHASELRAYVRGMHLPHPGIVIQANKRDLRDAVPMSEIAERFRSAGVEAALLESTASDGSGVREAFVFAVRLALDRVRELDTRGLLRRGDPQIDSAAELLLELQGEESEERNASPTKGLDEASDLLDPGAPLAGPAPLPSPLVPTGCIWRPVDGRIMVQQALAAGDLVLHTDSSGDYCANGTHGWRIHSRCADSFPDQDQGRAALRDWAHVHVRNQNLISAKRCVVLSPAGDRWRLWQIVAAHRSLEELLNTTLSEPLSSRGVASMVTVARKLVAAAVFFRRASLELPANLAGIDASGREPKFIGLMPGWNSGAAPDRAVAPTPAELIAQQLAQPLSEYARRVGPDLLVAELQALGRQAQEKESVSRILADLVRRTA